MPNDVWFYCKVDLTVLRHKSTSYSLGNDGYWYPCISKSCEGYIAIFKDGYSEKVTVFKNSYEHPCSVRLKFDIETRTLYIDTSSMFGCGEGIYKSGMYIADEKDAKWNFIDNLIEQYRSNIEKLITIKREIIRRDK